MMGFHTYWFVFITLSHCTRFGVFIEVKRVVGYRISAQVGFLSGLDNRYRGSCKIGLQVGLSGMR